MINYFVALLQKFFKKGIDTVYSRWYNIGVILGVRIMGFVVVAGLGVVLTVLMSLK